jgi:hypothetical protein
LFAVPEHPVGQECCGGDGERVVGDPVVHEGADVGDACGCDDPICLVSQGRENIGLGAITDIVQHTFGPVDLDRSPVELAPVALRHTGCPACAGRRFGFPADLGEAQATMCPTHHVKADTVIRSRLARANVSNPDGWRAIVDASAQRPGDPARRCRR